MTVDSLISLIDFGQSKYWLCSHNWCIDTSKKAKQCLMHSKLRAKIHRFDLNIFGPSYYSFLGGTCDFAYLCSKIVFFLTFRSDGNYIGTARFQIGIPSFSPALYVNEIGACVPASSTFITHEKRTSKMHPVREFLAPFCQDVHVNSRVR